MNGKQNLAARAGRWSAAHWKTATLGWVAFVVVAVVLGKVAGTVMLTDAEQSTGEAARAQAILQRRRLLAARRRERARAEPLADGERPGVSRDDRARCDEAARAARSAERPLAVRSRRRRGDLEGPPLGARPVLDHGRRSESRHEGPAGARRGRPAAGAEPRLHGRGVRLREREQGAERHARPGLSQGRAALGADHLPHPALRVRRVRRSRRAGAARLHGRARLDRDRRPDQPRLARIRRDELRDAADGHGGRRRLLALLLEARARRAPCGRRRRGAAARGRDLRPGRAHLGRHRADRDGRHASRRVEDLHVDRHGDDDRRVHVDGRLRHRAAGAARQARRPGRARGGRRLCRRRARAVAAAAPPSGLADPPARAADVPPAPQGRPDGVAHLGLDPATGAAVPRDLRSARRGGARAARAARPGNPHEAPELHRPAARHPDRQDLHRDPAGVPGRADAGPGRRAGAERPDAGGSVRDRVTRAARTRDGPDVPAGPAVRESVGHGRPHRDPARRQRRRREVGRRAPDAAQPRAAVDARKAPERRGTRSPARPQARTTSTRR